MASESITASDSKLGLLAGLAAVLLVAVVYFHKDSGLSGANIPGQVAADQGANWHRQEPRPRTGPNAGWAEPLDPSAGSDGDPIIHLPKPKAQTPPPDVLVRE